MFLPLSVKLFVVMSLISGGTLLLGQFSGFSPAWLPGAAGTALLASILFVKRYVTVPLGLLTNAMRLLEQGNSTAAMHLNNSRELRELSDSFNLMVRRMLALMDSTAQQVFELAQAQERLQHHAELIDVNRALEESLAEVCQLNGRQESLLLGTMNALVTAIEASDRYTHGHSARVTSYSLELAARINLPEPRVKVLAQACILHDIGKIGIDKNILHKPGKLSSEEYAVMKQHPSIAAKILKSIEYMAEVQDCVVKHHERFDGKGYPCGISGSALPIEARIMAIADTFDAMTSTRPYRKGLSLEITLRELHLNAGTQFDPELVEQFTAMVRERELKDPEADDRFAAADYQSAYITELRRQPHERLPVKVLVVEDDHLNSLVLRDHLLRGGHTVDEAATVSAGAELFEQSCYDLVLLSLEIRDADCCGFARNLRLLEQKLERGSAARAIICGLTSCPDDRHGPALFTSGLNRFLLKPLKTAVLAEVISLARRVHYTYPGPRYEEQPQSGNRLQTGGIRG